MTTVLDYSVRDNGYTYNDFCDFYKYSEATLMRIWDGHKRNQRISELLGKVLQESIGTVSIIGKNGK